MTEQYQQPNINLLPDAATFQGHLGVNTPIPGAALTPLPLTVETETSPLIQHLAGSSDLTFLVNGRVLAQWSVSIGNTNNARSQSATDLFIDTGSGFVPALGPVGYGYHRNAASGIGTTSSSLQFSVTQGDVIRLASIRIAGAGALQFIALACQLRVHLFPDI